MQIIVTCRAIIIHQNQLLMCQLSHNSSFLCLPGGKLDPGETLEAGMIRELTEETGVAPRVGKLLFVNQFLNPDNHRVEFFFHINNAADYIDFDPIKASHSSEIAKFVLADPAGYNLKPSFLRDRFADIVARGDQFATEIVVSR